MLRKIFKDSLPTMIAVMLASMYAVIDGLFVGYTTGDIGLAAINIAWPITAIIAACGIGIGTGGSVLYSYQIGKNNEEVARKTYGTLCAMLGILGAFLVVFLQLYPMLLRLLGASGEIYIEAEKYSSIIVMGAMVQVLGTGLLPVLRNMGMSMQAMCSMVLGLVANILVNYYLMFVVELGIQGAAYGTVIAQSLVMCSSLIMLYFKSKEKLYVSWDLQIVKKIIQSGLTPFGIYLAPSITLIFTNWQCIRYGGDPVVACYAVISYIAFPVQAMLAGIGDGTQPLLSYYYGAGQAREVKKIKRISQYMLVVIGSICSIICIVTSQYIGIWFGISEQANTYFVTAMIITAISYIAIGFTKYNVAYLNATMQSERAVKFTYIESLVINPTIVFLLPIGLGTMGIWWTATVTAIIVLVIIKVTAKKQERIEARKNRSKEE